MSNQQHNFILYVKNTRTFSFVTDLVSIAVSWFNTVNIPKIAITISKFQSIRKLDIGISLKNIEMAITDGLFSLTTKIDLAISLKKIQITIVLTQIKKFILGMDIKTISIDSVLSMLYRLGTVAIVVPTIGMVADDSKIIIAKFIALWTHDGKYLWEIDGVSLEDLDFTV